ncbi:MAG: ABC transporter substrate-binding protein, partial [Thermodesulfovibrionales bacterium]
MTAKYLSSKDPDTILFRFFMSALKYLDKLGVYIMYLNMKTLSLLFLFCVFLGACIHSADVTKTPKDTLVVAVSLEPKRLNPLFVTDSISHSISSLIFRGLTRLKEDLTIEGDLSVRWEIKDGGRVVIFHLRDGVFWHDMSPFTADDVVFTCRLLMSKDSTSAYSQRFSNISEIKALDSKTIFIRYRKPYGSILESWTIGILPRHIFERKDINQRETLDTLIGTGPFKIDKWINGQSIRLLANHLFYGEKPLYKSLHIRIIPDETTQILEFKNGAVDVFEVSVNQYRALTKDKFY